MFGEGHGDTVCGVPVLAHLPLDPKLTALCDKGVIELMENDYLDAAAAAIENAGNK